MGGVQVVDEEFRFSRDCYFVFLGGLDQLSVLGMYLVEMDDK